MRIHKYVSVLLSNKKHTDSAKNFEVAMIGRDHSGRLELSSNHHKLAVLSGVYGQMNLGVHALENDFLLVYHVVEIGVRLVDQVGASRVLQLLDL